MEKYQNPACMKIKDITGVLDDFAPPALQEPYDNAGLVAGNSDNKVNSVLLCLDVTEEVVEEAYRKGAELIISHHPVIFRKLNRLTGATYTERILISAVRYGIALYSAHTNIDKITGGVNSRFCEKLGLKQTRILSPVQGIMRKLVVFVPSAHAQKVREAIFSAGAGHIGEYDQCSFNVEGQGSFRGSEHSDPFAGKAGVLHFENEVRVETIYPLYLEERILKKMVGSHPYEEVAYDIYPLDNEYNKAGLGMIGYLDKPLAVTEFLKLLKNTFQTGVIRHSSFTGSKMISSVAVCGGSGASLIPAARKTDADIYVSGDIKYHDFFDADDNMMIADIGHFESERFTLDIFYELLRKKFPNFAVHFSEVNTNPIHYF